MKNLTRKLMLSIVAIALVVIALGTSTFAWFTLSNKAAVGQFNAEVTAGEGMELSLDETTWYSSIPSGVIQAKIKENFDLITDPNPANLNLANEPILSAVTTKVLDVSEFKKLDISNLAFIDAVANQDFIQLQVFVRAVGLTKIAVATIDVTGADQNWKADASFIHANGASITQNTTYKMSAANSARVAIKDLGTGAKEFVYQNPDKTSGNLVAASSNTALLGSATPAFTTTGQSKPDMYTEALNGQEKYFVEKSHPLYVREFAGYPDGYVEAGVATTSDADLLTLTVGTLPADIGYNVGSFNLFVWFEGFDADTYDAILKMPLSVKMSFIGTAA